MGKVWGAKPKLKRAKFFIYLGIILVSLFVLSGCGTLQTLIQNDGEASPLAEWIGEPSQETSIPAISNLGDGKTVSLYFPDLTGKALVKEERTLPKTLSLARETVHQWLRGPAVTGNSQAAVNPATTLLDIAIKDGVAIVDLSREFTEVYGKVSQEVAVYGLVNTLTQFPTVRGVNFRIDGKTLKKLGNLDLTNLSYREGLVKGSNSVSSTSGNVAGGNSVVGSDNDNKLSVPVQPASGNLNNQGSNSVLPDSPSSINLFSFPPSST